MELSCCGILNTKITYTKNTETSINEEKSGIQKSLIKNRKTSMIMNAETSSGEIPMIFASWFQ